MGDFSFINSGPFPEGHLLFYYDSCFLRGILKTKLRTEKDLKNFFKRFADCRKDSTSTCIRRLWTDVNFDIIQTKSVGLSKPNKKASQFNPVLFSSHHLVSFHN